MLRKFHSFSGLIAGLFVVVLALSGAVLSLDPALERAGVDAGAEGQSLASLAAMVQAQIPGVERIDRRANGAVVVGYATPDSMGSVIIDPTSGAILAEDAPSGMMAWVKSLHRSFLLDDAGRAAAGISAGAMVLLCATGLLMLLATLGGWRRLARPVRGARTNRLHASAGRIGIAALAISAATGAFLSLANFGFISDGSDASPAFPFKVAGTAPAPVASLTALQSVPLRDLRRLTFPQPDDPADVFGLQTAQGSGYVDQATGAVLTWLPHSPMLRLWETVYMLHTGQGLWWFGLMLGLGALCVPVLSVTGVLIWFNRRRAQPRIKANTRAAHADTVILVGSEGGSTWGFARTLHDALTAAGHRVHTAPMNAMTAYPAAERLFILAATYGDGAPPASARQFLDRLARLPIPSYPVTVLGFGDRMFPDFCGYAAAVETALRAKGWQILHPITLIDRQSTIDFAAWGRAIGQSMGLDLRLDHHASLPPRQTLRLISRQDFGRDVQAPTTIFRFGPDAPAKGWRRFWALPRFQAGDLIGIVPPGCDLPRYYSLASSRRDGAFEICVRKSPGGLCSGHLHGLAPGDTIQAFIRPNPDFRPVRGKAPVVLIAAGCGIGPMAGFLRANRPGRQMELYFGTRDPASDFLYEQDLDRWQADGRLTRLVTAFSRVNGRRYVQDRVRHDAAHLRDLIARGGQVMVCGGMLMARAVAAEIDQALAPLGLDVAGLKAEGRYLEDVY